MVYPGANADSGDDCGAWYIYNDVLLRYADMAAPEPNRECSYMYVVIADSYASSAACVHIDSGMKHYRHTHPRLHDT